MKLLSFLICTLFVTHVDAGVTSSFTVQWLRYGPGACDTVISLSAVGHGTLTTTTSATAAAARYTYTFLSGAVEFKPEATHGNIQVGWGQNAASNAIYNLDTTAVGYGTATAVFAAYSSDVLTVAPGVANTAGDDWITTVAGLCIRKNLGGTATDVKVLANMYDSTGVSMTVNAYATADGTTVTWDTSSPVIAGTEGTVKVTFQTGAAVAASSWLVLSVDGYTFASGCTCTLGTTSTDRSAEATSYCGYDYAGVKTSSTSLTDNAANYIKCDKATPRAAQTSITNGVCIADKGASAGLEAIPERFKCGNIPAVTATSAPTASPSTAACAGGGAAAATAALWGAAPSHNPSTAIAIVIAFILAIIA